MADTSVYTSLWNYQLNCKGPNLWTYLRFSPVSPFMQKHICKVHFMLALGFALNSLATYLQQEFPVSTPIAWFGVWAPFFLVLFTKPAPNNEEYRSTLFLITSFSKGLLVDSFYHPYLGFNVRVLESGILGTSAVLLSFSIAASLTTKRIFIFLGAALLCALSAPFGVALAAAEFGKSVYEPQIFSALMVVAGLLGLETQYMIERGSSAGVDPVWDAFWVVIGVYMLPYRVFQAVVNTVSGPAAEAEKKKE